MDKLLKGIKVLDLSRVLSGPFASTILSDLGAEVIKVELPKKGDEARGFGPFKNGESLYYASVNRGKKSLTIDLRKPKGQALVRELAKRCDIILENFRPGSMKKFNLDYESIKKESPHIIYASLSGFGQSGLYSERPAYDVLIQAMSGLASITGPKGGDPLRVGSSISDLSSALYCVIGILAAVNQTKRTGVGQHIDVSMLDCSIALLENAISRYYNNRIAPVPIGSQHPSIVPFQFFKAKDSFLVVACGNNNLWKSLCNTLGIPELIEDERFLTNDKRVENHKILEGMLTEIFGNKIVKEWCELLQGAGIPCGPVYNVEEMVQDPHVISRDMITKVMHPTIGEMSVPNFPLQFSKTKIKVEEPSPLLGQHTTEVLQGFLGKTNEELALLREEEVI